MGRRVKDFIEIKDCTSLDGPQTAGGAACDAGNAESYLQARAHVLEACSRGLVRMMVVS